MKQRLQKPSATLLRLASTLYANRQNFALAALIHSLYATSREVLTMVNRNHNSNQQMSPLGSLYVALQSFGSQSLIQNWDLLSKMPSNKKGDGGCNEVEWRESNAIPMLISVPDSDDLNYHDSENVTLKFAAPSGLAEENDKHHLATTVDRFIFNLNLLGWDWIR